MSIQKVERYAYNGKDYPTREAATMAAIRSKLGLSPEGWDKLDPIIKENATELINLLSVFSRKQVRMGDSK